MRFKKLSGVLAAAALLGATAGPAAAHFVEVRGEPKAFAGGGALPGQGAGLVPGGPPWAPIIQSPAHVKGLNTACYAIRDTNAPIDIYGPGGPGCEHGQ